MMLAHFAKWANDCADEPMLAELALKELAKAALAYRPQTHSELYAFDEITSLANERTASELAARGHE